MRKVLLTALLGALLALPAAAGENGPRDVEFASPEGPALKGTYYAAAGPGPGILLLNQCNRNRAAWKPLAPALAEAGFHVLTFDWQGTGESGGEAWGWEGSIERAIRYWRTRWGPDLEEAVKILRAQPGVQGDRLGVVGASCGVYMAILLGQREPEALKSMVLLSGMTNEVGLDFVRTHPEIPIFGLASREDAIGTENILRIVGSSDHPRSRRMLYSGAGHGTDMLQVAEDLKPMIVSWFRRTMMPKD
jgi:dienelactone hydrolase